MDNSNGGQAMPSWNKVYANSVKAANNKTTPDFKTVGSTEKERELARHRQTVTDLARRRLLDAYNKQSGDYRDPEVERSEGIALAENNATNNGGNMQGQSVNPEDWRKYHSAWQDYYQKYYGEYYGRAAREYVAREKMKMERDQAEQARKIAEKKTLEQNATVRSNPDDLTEEELAEKTLGKKIRKNVRKRANKIRKSHHFVPIVIGLIILVCGILLQYNQTIAAHIMAYVVPNGGDTNSITAIDVTLTAATHDKPTLMVPKLNIEVPITFGAKNDVASMNKAMSNGVAHYSIPGANANPGEIGNFVISGHSAGNVYGTSNYKFIFSGLTRMTEGDLIYVDYNSQRYTYSVTGSMVVKPSEVSKLKTIADENSGKPMITLITCTPLGTSKYRLLLYGEQIYPSYDDNTATAAPSTGTESETEMPANDPTPFEQIWKWLTGQE